MLTIVHRFLWLKKNKINCAFFYIVFLLRKLSNSTLLVLHKFHRYLLFEFLQHSYRIELPKQNNHLNIIYQHELQTIETYPHRNSSFSISNKLEMVRNSTMIISLSMIHLRVNSVPLLI